MSVQKKVEKSSNIPLWVPAHVAKSFDFLILSPILFRFLVFGRNYTTTLFPEELCNLTSGFQDIGGLQI